MKRILINTNTYTAFKRNVGEVVETLRRVDYIGINTVVLGELYGGFKGGSKEKRNLLLMIHSSFLNKFLTKFTHPISHAINLYFPMHL